jgi:hypothetical protein
VPDEDDQKARPENLLASDRSDRSASDTMTTRADPLIERGGVPPKQKQRKPFKPLEGFNTLPNVLVGPFGDGVIPNDRDYGITDFVSFIANFGLQK